ncbi:RNA/RNP complex-1-interacting phosphatase isoform X1 [Bufo gargarizans]|uniref:RNA/RNP complex-1-interacting phosphatase isoform X1 n=1 Tax=Bufo gargarizans TaxID=30331 RepID=UPI001CF1D259|nr:RNA/RNP complex-1-interacting phosphatase isoform X1 [Bufo gargarizans]
MAVHSLLKFPVSFLRIPVCCHIHLQSAAMKHNSIPDRWTEYIPVGKRIPGTRFIAFKVPLKNMYDNKLSPWQRFSPSDLVKEVAKQNEELGLVVDLTCTKRYYSPSELPKTIKYSKIFTVGQQVPSDDVIAQFKRIVKQYLTQNSDNDKLVGVHCTHGLNRTGYLVCRYLIDMLSMEPSEAIEKFNNSRGHIMERSNYLDDLLHGKSQSSAELDKPHVNKRHSSNGNLQRYPCPRDQPRNHSYDNGTQRPFAQPSFHHNPRQVMGPQHGFPHAGGRHPSQGPRIPSPGFVPPHMSGPRHNLHQMEDYSFNQFRGPNRRRHYPQRPFPEHTDYGAVNGPPPQDRRPRFPQQGDSKPGNGFPAQSPHSQQRGNSKPYRRYPGPGRQEKPKKQWQ